MDEAIQAQIEMEASLANTENELIQAAKKRSLLMRKEPKQSSQATSPGNTNRKKPGTRTKTAEISAATKVKYCEEMLADKANFTRPQDFWKAQQVKFGLTKRQLSHMLSQHENYKHIVESQSKLCRLRRFERTKKEGWRSCKKSSFPRYHLRYEDMAQS